MIDQRFQQHYRALAFLAIGEISRAKKLMMWGTYGKGGVEHCYGTCPEHQLRWVRLIDCSTEHLHAILRTQSHIGHDYTRVFNTIIQDRN